QMLHVLNPLEVRDDHPTGVGEQVWYYVDAFVDEQLVSGWGGRAVRPLEQHAAVEPVSVTLVDHAPERRRNEDIALDLEQLLGIDALRLLVLGQLASRLHELM